MQFGISPVVLVFNDNALGVLQDYQRARFNDRLMAVGLVNADFVKLAGSCRPVALGLKTQGSIRLTRALRKAAASDRVRLIDVSTPQGFGALVQAIDARITGLNFGRMHRDFAAGARLPVRARLRIRARLLLSERLLTQYAEGALGCQLLTPGRGIFAAGYTLWTPANFPRSRSPSPSP